MNKLRVFEAFSGIGAQHMALEILAETFPGFTFEVVGISEIDKHANKVYKTLFGNKVTNYGDIKEIKWEKVPDFDLFTYSFPCQNISLTGNQSGFKRGSGTQSSLLWECMAPILIKKPEFLLMENVKNILSAKFSLEFNEWINFLANQGYSSQYHVLDAQDFGVPQHRERFFMVSIRGDRDFTFPQGMSQIYNLSAFLDRNNQNIYRVGA